MKNYRKSMMWWPIIGTFLVIYFHSKYKDVLSLIDRPFQFFGSAVYQSAFWWIAIYFIPRLING